jgi:ABC-type Fe3+/spermidine/putrescine transport system ATPase subunit
VAQVGTAEDLFERPTSRFVAQFIGRTNLLDGTVAEPGVVVRDGVRLRVAGADAKPGTSVAVSIRPHAITLIASDGGPAGGPGDNVLPGVVKRASYLGAGVDYEVDVAGVTLRVAAPTALRVAPGAAVTLVVPIARCLPLPAA